MKIEEAISQPHFYNDMHRAHVNILYTASWLNQQTANILKPYDISVQQFNILRILRGMGTKPVTIKLLTERMLDKMSNASRLVEKLRSKGFVDRQECPSDRRRVDITITQQGLEVVNQASQDLEQQLFSFSGEMANSEMRQLSELLDKLRSIESPTVA